MKIIGIIPARGGSKGIKRKNVKIICNKPLIYWTICSAKNSKLLSDFYISTEDNEIKELSQSFGCKVISRPKELSGDEITTLQVLQDCAKKIDCDAFMILQPTSPVRHASLIDECINEFIEKNADTLATGFICKFIEYGKLNNVPRQKIEGFFYDDGNVYIINKKIIEDGRWVGNKIIKKIISNEENVDIDNEFDFFIAEKILEKYIYKNVFTNYAIFNSIELLIMDVDGVLTGAEMYYSDDGNELKKFSTYDGMGIELIKKIGIKTAFMTKEKNNIIDKRAKKMNIDFVYQGINNKYEALLDLVDKSGISLDKIAYIGDDVNDIKAMQNVILPIAPSNAVESVKKISKYVTVKKGGSGAVREICDLIISFR